MLLRRTEERVAAGTRSPATLAMQQQHVGYLLERIGPRTTLARLDRRRIARALFEEQKGRRRRLSGCTLRKRASTLRHALRLAEGQGWIRRVPPFPEIPYRYIPRGRHIEHWQAYEQLRDHMPPDRRLWFALAIWTGQRKSDINRMVREDFDADERWVIVRSTKTKRTQGVRVHAAPELVRELAEHWRALEPGAQLVPAWRDPNGYLRRACRRLDLPKLTSQSFRHTFFTWFAAANGFTAEMLAIGGWATFYIPSMVYAHALPARFRPQVERAAALAARLRPVDHKLSRKRKSGPTSFGDGAERSGVGAIGSRADPGFQPTRNHRRG